MELSHTFTLKGKKYEISVDYMRGMQILPKIPKEIGIKLLKNEEYTVQSQVQPEIFQNFLDYWQNSKEPEIISDNFFEYYLLNKEFGLMTEYLSEKYDQVDFHISSLKYLSNNQQNAPIDKSDHEKYIAMHLDNFLEKNEGKMLEISINSLFNIFFHKDRVLNNQQLALDFINKNKEQYSQLTILLPSLNAEELNHEKVFESLSNTEENFGFMPKINQSFLGLYYKQNQDYEKILSKLTGYFVKDEKKDIFRSILCEQCFPINLKIVYEDDKSRFEATPLCAAVSLNDVDLVKHLLEKPKVDINMKSIYEENKYSHYGTIRLFPDTEEKIKYDEVDVSEITPLHLAIENKNAEIIKLLLGQPELDINIKSTIENGRKTLSHLELSSQSLKLAKSFVKSPESILQSKEKLYKSAKAVPEIAEITPLFFAIDKNDNEIIKLLLERPDLDVNIKSNIQKNYIFTEIESKKLIDGSNVGRNEEKTALHLAIERNNVEIIKLLLERKELDINMKSIEDIGNATLSLFSFVFFGLLVGQIQSSESIFELKIPLDKEIINFRDDMVEKSALHLAIENKNIEIIKLLLSNSKLNINDKKTVGGYVKYSISESEKLEIQNKTPQLFEYITNSDNEISTKKEETTALHIAVENSDTEIIKTLLENKNINIDATDEQGRKPIDLTNDQEIKSLLTSPRK